MSIDQFIAKLIHLDAGDGCPIHVAAAILKPDKRGTSRVVSGRGPTAEEAEKRCIAEAAERQAAIFDPDHALTYASLDELGTTASDPRAILLISERQYESAPLWNRSVEADHRLPARFDAQARIGWVAARAIGAGERIHVPAAHVFLGYPDAVAEGFPVPDSSGLAAGLTSLSALDRALLELIERDAVSIWWYSRARRPEMRFAYDKIPWFGAFADWIHRSGRRFWILDLGHDLGIPVASAISCDEHGRNPSFGFAAGRSRHEAAASALGELVQFDLTKRVRGGRDIQNPAHFLDWCGAVAVGDHAFLRPDPQVRHGDSDTNADPVTALSGAGLEPLFMELPAADQATHVVRAIVPGLRPIWPRFAPGRLFDIPCRLGWFPDKLRETELNPDPILY
jgi:ribosomal protein S12 methylthiotransferase accessory factor